MAQAKSIRFGKSFILVQDPDETTPTFVAPCGFEQITMSLNVESNNTNLPDCDDPDMAGWNATDITSMQMTLAGEGVLDTDAMQFWQAWWYGESGLERNVRFFRDLLAANGGGYFEGPAVVTAYEETGQRGQRWRLSVTVAFNGKPTFTPATP